MIVIFVVCVALSLAAERRALILAYSELTGRRWQGVAVFLAGGMLAAVFVAVSSAVSRAPGGYGLVALMLMLVLDGVLLVRHERQAHDCQQREINQTDP